MPFYLLTFFRYLFQNIYYQAADSVEADVFVEQIFLIEVSEKIIERIATVDDIGAVISFDNIGEFVFFEHLSHYRLHNIFQRNDADNTTELISNERRLYPLFLKMFQSLVDTHILRKIIGLSNDFFQREIVFLNSEKKCFKMNKTDYII